MLQVPQSDQFVFVSCISCDFLSIQYNAYHTIHSTDMKGWSYISKSLSKRGKPGLEQTNEVSSELPGDLDVIGSSLSSLLLSCT